MRDGQLSYSTFLIEHLRQVHRFAMDAVIDKVQLAGRYRSLIEEPNSANSGPGNPTHSPRCCSSALRTMQLIDFSDHLRHGFASFWLARLLLPNGCDIPASLEDACKAWSKPRKEFGPTQTLRDRRPSRNNLFLVESLLGHLHPSTAAWGFLALDQIRKPSYYAIYLLNELQGTRLKAVPAGGRPASALMHVIATRDVGDISILIASVVPSQSLSNSAPELARRVFMNIEALGSGKTYSAKIERIDCAALLETDPAQIILRNARSGPQNFRYE